MGLLCKMRGHQADRGIARHDGEDYWSVCKRCGVELIRDMEGWREPTAEEATQHAANLGIKRSLNDAAGLG